MWSADSPYIVLEGSFVDAERGARRLTAYLYTRTS